MITKKNSRVFLTLTTLTFAFVSPPTADAADAKVYPGMQCMGSQYGDSSILHGSEGSVFNLDPYYNFAWCPIVTDNENNQDGLSRARVYVWESADPAEQTQCTLYVFNSLGVAVDGVSAMASDSPGGNQYFDMPLDSSPTQARYGLACWLSGYSTLYEYEIEERN